MARLLSGPSAWTAEWSENYGMHFWFNHVEQRVQWDEPFGQDLYTFGIDPMAWERHWSEEHGRFYWWNLRRLEPQWMDPEPNFYFVGTREQIVTNGIPYDPLVGI
jgi:hypothetical protein